MRLRVVICGAVQGVGFRPFVFRLAETLKLSGWVKNSAQGVFIEVEGERSALEKFLARLETERPPQSFIQSLESSWLDAAGFNGFEIRESEKTGDRSALMMPDIATCPDCLREILDPQNRRHRYPFTNCTHCGPRFSIIEALPYDRARTSMKRFAMCPACRHEYDDPRDRRFHAQPNACPVCGPRLELWSRHGEVIFGGDEALLAAAQMIRRGKIIAVKGLGGFHLMADARNEKAVCLLRERKHRGEKPFAVMFPTVSEVKLSCEVSEREERLLRSPEAPIVLLRKIVQSHSGYLLDGKNEMATSVGSSYAEIAPSIAPGNPYFGVMLPSNPLHHLLMQELDFPVVATSGNLSDEPICTDEQEALTRLGGVADLFLVHNRPIVRHMDDSIVGVMVDRELVLRRARGYAPLPVQIINSKLNIQNVLAVGAHLKNSVALAVGQNVFISQHIGDLETEAAHGAFHRAVVDLPELYETEPGMVVADLHPDYLSTKFALESSPVVRSEDDGTGHEYAHPETGVPQVRQVQHHVAHALSCIAENEVELPALGVVWDGTGYGTDGTVWGGEFFLITDKNVERVAHLRPFKLPGSDMAVKEPRRVALALLYELYGEAAFEMVHLPPLREMPPVEMITLKGMLQRRFNSPPTSSVGRLFDAVASLVNLRHQMQFEGQAAMDLEFVIGNLESNDGYNLPLVTRQSLLVLDWAQMIKGILSDMAADLPLAQISVKFHNALAESVIAVSKHAGQKRVTLSGGCFQNRYLTDRVVKRLREEGFLPYWHQRVPPNDGGIALGQVMAAGRDEDGSFIVNPKL